MLKERLERKKEFGRLDEIKASLAAKEQTVASLEASWESGVWIKDRSKALEEELGRVKEENTQLSIQCKNAQEDVNFAEMCVKNLQATLAVYKKEEKAEAVEEEVKEEEVEEEEKVEEAKSCEECEKKDKQIEAQQARLCVMDAELVKTRLTAKQTVGMRGGSYV